MKYLVFLALFPCILATEIHQTDACVDGTQCPQGKYCCEFGCCDISMELEDKVYVSALPPSVALPPANITVSMAEHKYFDDSCLGTQCGLWCHTGTYDATCCSDPQFACRSKTKCCSNSDSEEPWCCKQDQGCSSLKDYCTNNIDTCSGTQCGPYCHEDAKDATCCSNPQFACPSETKCCTSSDSEEPWCCKKDQDCSPLKDKCIIKVDTCSGTICGYYCHDIKDATCCNDPMYACPSKSKCCSNSDIKEPWCCKQSQSCGITKNNCINSAMTTSIATLSLLLSFMIGIVSKMFL